MVNSQIRDFDMSNSAGRPNGAPRTTIDLDGTGAPELSRPLSRSPAAVARITVKNRRKRYLDTHPDYFDSPSLELTGLPAHL